MISSDLMDVIIQYFDARITIGDLEEWLVPREPTFLLDPDSDDADIIATIELGLAEMNDDLRTEDEFRNLLRRVFREKTTTVWAEYQPSNFHNVTGTANTTFSPPLVYSNPYQINSPVES